MVGGYVGVGGLLATIRFLAERLDLIELRESWTTALSALDWPGLATRATADPVTGGIGLALALTADHRWKAELPSGIVEALEAVASDALANAGEPIRSPGASARLNGLPGTGVARALVQARLGINLGDEPIQSILGGPSVSTGDLIGIAAVSTQESPWWPALCALAIERIEQDQSADYAAPIAAAELALELDRTSDEGQWRDLAVMIAGGWVKEWQETGTWLAGDLADDRFQLSAIWGTPAMMMVFLRLADSSLVRSVRLLNLGPACA